MYTSFKERGGKALKHNGLEDAEISIDTMSHSIFSHCPKNKAQLLMSPKQLQQIYEAGFALREEVRKTKGGKIDRKKKNWLECWHIKGNVRINNRRVNYDFTVAKVKSQNKNAPSHWEVYDLTLH